MKTNLQSNPSYDDLLQHCALLEEKNRDLIARIRSLSEENRHNESLLRVLLESTPFGIVLIDSKQRIIQINKAAETLLMAQRVEVVGRTCDSIFNCFIDNNQKCPVLHENKAINQVETVCHSKVCDCDKSLLRSVVQIQDRDETVLVEAFVDISKIKQAQLEIENANTTKDNFLSKVSHELRTPLNAILGFTELLKDSLAVEADSDNSQYLDNIYYSSKNLLRMVDEVLDITRITANRLKLDEYQIEIDGLLKQVSKEVKEHWQEHNNRIMIKPDHHLQYIYADPYRLHQLLSHILDNACKFTQNGEICISVIKETLNNRPAVAFIIEDTGEGMSEEQQARVFHEFEQADMGHTRRHNGAGLGLTLCKEITRLMGGEIRVSSQLGKGSEFTLLLPDKQLETGT